MHIQFCGLFGWQLRELTKLELGRGVERRRCLAVIVEKKDSFQDGGLISKV